MRINSCEKTGPFYYELELAVSAEKFEEELAKVYKRDAKKYSIPGFRKGRVPRKMIETRYGEEVFFDEAINDLLPSAYEEAVKEANLEPVAQPEVDIVSASKEDGVVLKIVVTVKPEVKLGQYKGLEVEKAAATVDETLVDAEITRLQERNARLLTREGAAQDGDIADIDYEGSVDEVPFEGGKDAGHKLTLGSGQFIPGFEEQVLGRATGDEFDVTVTFPEEYHAEQLAGKEAVFKVKVNDVQCKELPELDDEFAKDVSDYDTMGEYKGSIRTNLQAEADKKSDAEVENSLVDQLVEGLEGEIPEAMYESRMDEIAQDFAARLDKQGLNLKTYLQYTGMDAVSFRAGFKDQAEKQVKMRLAMGAIAELENLIASEEEVDAEIAKIAESYSIEPEKAKELLPLDEIEKDLAMNKAIDFVKDNAKIIDKKD